MKKNGFTIIEIVVVIAIIWILAILSTNFNFNKKTAEEKWSRMINGVLSIIKTEIFNAQAWKWVDFWSWIVNPDYREIKLSNSWIIVNYIWSKTITWAVFNYPFYWENFYEIKDIFLISKDWFTWAISNPFSVIINWSDISFSWASWVKLSITAWFKPEYKTLELDRRTWIIEIK